MTAKEPEGTSMENRHLRYFVAVAEHRNFTRAAEASFVAQSSLSHQIARLESELGAQLFVRGHHHVELTEAGRVLLPLARRVLAAEDTAKSEVRAYMGLERGRLRLGLIQTSTHSPATGEALATFRRQYPALSLHVVALPSEELVALVANGELDLAIIGLSPEEIPPALTYQVLSAEPLVGVIPPGRSDASSPMAVHRFLSLGALIHFAQGSGIRRRVDEVLARAGVSDEPTIELNQAVDLVRFVSLGLGVTIVPKSLAGVAATWFATPAAVGFTTVELDDKAAVHPVGIIQDPKRPVVAAEAFVELLQDRHRQSTASMA